MATAVSCASPVTNLTSTPELIRVWMDSRTCGLGGSQIPTMPMYVNSCSVLPLAKPTTLRPLRPISYEVAKNSCTLSIDSV